MLIQKEKYINEFGRQEEHIVARLTYNKIPYVGTGNNHTLALLDLLKKLCCRNCGKFFILNEQRKK